MDITESVTPKSDQQNYDDVATTPRTVTITKVTSGSAEQPVEIHLAEFPGRPYKPSKSMRRVLIAAWGPEASAYVGRRMTLYGDATVKFGGIALGGIKISHLSDIEKTHTMMLTETRGKRNAHTINPIVDAPKESTNGISAAQVKTIGFLMGELEIKGRDAALAYSIKVIGREIKSSSDLTADEAAAVIDALTDARPEKLPSES